jgi:hypothetical protein
MELVFLSRTCCTLSLNLSHTKMLLNQALKAD